MLTDEEQNHIRKVLDRNPTELEREMFRVLWSERVSYRYSKQWFNEFYTDDERIISEIGEGAALFDLGDDIFLSLAMESRNHTTQRNPYEGAKIGVGGIIRDVLSRGCKAVGLMNFLHFEIPDRDKSVEELELIIKGLSEYGNPVGIPMIGGETEFDNSFKDLCIINLVCIGVSSSSRIIKTGAENPGHLLVLFGSATGRDTWTWGNVKILKREPELEFSGNPLSKKILIDTLQELLDESLIDSMQDLGRGGIAAAAAQLALRGKTGIEIDSDKIPMRFTGLKSPELLTSRSQERMLAVVSPDKIQRVSDILVRNKTPFGIIGKITEEKVFTVIEDGEVKANLPMEFLVDGYPELKIPTSSIGVKKSSSEWFTETDNHLEIIKKLLSSVNMCDKSWIYSQYDQHVQTNTLVDIGENAGVVELPKGKRLAFTGGSNSSWCHLDPFTGTANSACEALSNLVAMGATPILMADCLNFGNPNRDDTYSHFVEAVRGLGQFSHDFKIPVVAGSVSFFNEVQIDGGFRQIYPTPQIMMAGLFQSGKAPVKRSLHTPLSNIFLIGETHSDVDGTEFQKVVTGNVSGLPPKYRPEQELNSMNAILQAHSVDFIRSCNNIGRGGLGIALMKMVLYSDFGFKVDLEDIPGTSDSLVTSLFSETTARYLAEVSETKQSEFMEIMQNNNCQAIEIGLTINEPIADFGVFKISRKKARECFQSKLPKLMN